MCAARVLRVPTLFGRARLLMPKPLVTHIKHFHQSRVLANKHYDLAKAMSEIVKKIELTDSLVEKFTLGEQLARNEHEVRRLLEDGEHSNDYDLTLVNALEVTNANRYRTVFSFLLDRFKVESKIVQETKAFKPDLLESIVSSFSTDHAKLEPLADLEVKELFHIFAGLLNRETTLEDLLILDPKVQSLIANFAWEDASELTEDVRAAAAEAFNAEPEAITRWFEIRQVFCSVPYSLTVPSLDPLNPDQNLDDASTFAPHASLAQALKNFKDQMQQEQGDGKKSKSENEKRGDKKDEKLMMFRIAPEHMRWVGLGLLVGFLWAAAASTLESNHEISFQEFTSDFLRKNHVARICVVNNRTAILELNENGKEQHPGRGEFYFNIGSVESFERSLKAVQDEFKIPDLLRLPVIFTTEGSATKMLVNFLPTLLFLGAIYYMTKKASMGGMGGPMGFGKSTAKKFNQEKDIKIKFKDVAGMDEAKEEVMEFVKFLQNPSKYQKLGAKIPRGAILSGPPGTGKTLIARATAGEAGVPFYSVSGSEFVEMFVGVGASRVRDLFKTARENAPSIVFVDEIDAIGKQRSKGNASGANDERETTLNQLLVEMDGFESSDHVVVLAGTNRPDILDKALMRPGRFDRHISIDNPELQGRKEIFDVHLKKIKLVDDIDPDLSGRLAALTPGFSGADIANVCNEAALIAARYNAKSVTLRHFELAIERVIGGVEKKSKLLDPEEKRIVAYHEAGHAVCGWFLKHAHPLLKVSIIPRGQGALGYAQYLPPDQYLYNGLQLYDRMIMTLGGRVSEELNFASVTSGAYDDFKKVTGIAQSMVMRFGMSPKVGMVNYADSQGQDTLTKPFSDETNKTIDEEVKRIVRECYDKCKELLTEKSKEVEIVANELLKKEFITREDMIRLLGKRPFAETNDAFDKYLDGKDAFKNEKPADEKKDEEN